MTPEIASSVIDDVNNWLARKNGHYSMTDLNGEIICRIKKHYVDRGGRYGRLHFLKNRSIFAQVSNDEKIKHLAVIYPYKDDTNTTLVVDALNFNFRQILYKEKPLFNFDNIKNFKF